MSKIPEPLNTIPALIDAHHAAKLDKPRPHLGCSMLAELCDRRLWLQFRFAVIEKFDGRMLRLFRRGHNEEKTLIADLEAIGIRISGTQDRVDFGSHVSGSIDGLADGVPEAPKTTHIVEFKTHSQKSFDELCKDGVRKAKPLHYGQMNVYMLGKGLERALYIAVCKNNDALYTERVKLDREYAEKLVERGRRIALSERMPPPISTDGSWYQCKWCPAWDMCHGSRQTKEANCRTCAHSTPLPNSTWHCAKWDAAIPLDAQINGCDAHVVHPDLVPWEWVGGDSINAVYIIDGAEVVNGEGGKKTKELLDG